MCNYHVVRTISFASGGLTSTDLLSATVWRLPRNIFFKIFYFLVGGLFLMSIVMNQIRSVCITIITADSLILMVFQRRGRIPSFFCFTTIMLVVTIITILIARWLVSEIDFVEMGKSRFYVLTDTVARDGSISTRARALRVEMQEWLEGTWILGSGLYFFQILDRGNRNIPYTWISFGHLGNVTYLSQLCLIGLVVYGIDLPLSVFRNSRHVWLIK